MIRLKLLLKALGHIAVTLSVIFNLVFLVVIILLVIFIFNLKTGIIQPLVNNLYGSFVGLDQSSILTTIKVQDSVPVKLTIPLQTQTTVILTSDVPVRANATFSLPGGGGTINGSVSIVLPTGLKLPVALDLSVPVNDKLPISLNVPVNIRVQDTQLHDPITQLQDTLKPYVRLLGNLPDNWGQVPAFIGKLLAGTNLLQPNQASENAWPGFHTDLGTPVPTLAGVPTLAPITSVPLTLTPINASGAIPPTGAPPAGTPIPPTSQPPAAPKPTNGADLGILTPTPH
ncbi:MAG: hypothetical protein ACYDBJ_26460 [Aggregatilineales bacterium]